MTETVAELNPLYDLGEAVLAIEFSPFLLRRHHQLVIVAGNSNGGGAALYAGEADERGLIDGIVAAQPQVQLDPDDRVSVTRGGRTLEGSGRPLLDYFTFALIHQPCAALALPDAPWAERVTFARERCESLIEAGLTDANTPEDAAEASLAALRDYGWETESDMLHPSHYVIAPTATDMAKLLWHLQRKIQSR